MKLLTLFPKIKISLATPKQLKIQTGIKKYLLDKKTVFTEYDNFADVLPEVDVLYVTRVKKEYMSEELYNQVKGSYIINKSLVQKMKKKSIIMHCLPRIDEIQKDVDQDPRAIYLPQQVINGLYVRMAILDLILRKE